MRESEFIASIECRFPYSDRQGALELADAACSISSNAAFAVVDEITRPPAGQFVDPAITEAVLSMLEARLAHPLALPVLALARRVGNGTHVSVDDAVLVLKQVEQFPGEYAALSIAYFASDDVDGIADAEFRRISASWDEV